MTPRRTLTIANFFTTAHFFLIVYIITPYLATFLPDSETGLVVSLGALVTLSVFPFLPELVRRYGTRRLAIFFALIEIFVLGWLAVEPVPVAAFILIALSVAVTPLLAYQMDLMLEATIAREGDTGRARTLFLTSANITLVFAPLVAGLLLDSSEQYWKVFAVAASTLLPFIFLMSVKRLPPGGSPKLVTMMEAVLAIMSDKDLRSVVIAHGALQLFFHTGPLFISLYLHSVLGIPWEHLGWMFMIMLLPLAVIEYPVGWLADRIFGDKEILILGFVILSIGFAALALVNENTRYIWIVLILVVNRTGAALVEAMSEGHFFRRVSEADASTVGIFRMTRPVAALIGPIIGSIILAIAGFKAMFVATALIVGIMGVMAARKITDIKIETS